MNFQQSFRIIFRNKTYSILNILGLSVGITAAALIFLWVENIWNFNQDIPKLKNIYQVAQNQHYADRVFTPFVAPGPLYQELDEHYPEIKCNTRYGWGETLTFALEEGDVSFAERGNYADATIFNMIGMTFLEGNAQVAFDPAFPIVISEKMAQKIFKNENPIGKSLQDENKRVYQVTGVFQNLSKNITFKFEWLIPFRIMEKDYYDKKWVPEGDWGSNWMRMYVELHPSSEVDAVNQKLKTLVSEKTDRTENNELFIYPLSKTRLYGEFVDGKPTGGGYIRTVRMFFSIGLVILLIACINFMNLATARSEKRSLEVGVRKALGSKRFALIRQFMGESGLITCIALLLSVLLIFLCLPAFNQLVSENLILDVTNWVHVVGLLGIGLICTILAGSYPAFYLSSFSPLSTLKKLNTHAGNGVIWIRKGLVVFQFAIAFILICATTVIYLQIRHVHDRPLGYDIENVVSFGISEKIRQNGEFIINEIMNTGLVENAGLSSDQILTIGSNGGGYDWQGKDAELNPLVSMLMVSPGLLETFQMKLVDGNDFSSASLVKDYLPEVIINETLANMMGEEGRVGGHIWQGTPDNKMEIIGIVNDFVFNEFYEATSAPVAIFLHPKATNYLFVRMKPDINTGQSLVQLQSVLRKFSPNESFDPVHMDDRFNRQFVGRQLEGKLAVLFASLAIFISCLGLFGLSAFSAEQRTKEIGIRKVLGAKIKDVLVLLVRNYMFLILIAFVIGIPIAWYAAYQYLSDYTYRISLSWPIFAGVAFLVIFIALLTVSMQSLRAATANPVKAIKSE